MNTDRVLHLKDSQYLLGQAVDDGRLSPAIRAVDALHGGKITPLSFGRRQIAPVAAEEVVSYQVALEDTGTTVHSARFFTSHYVGCFSHAPDRSRSNESSAVVIRPRSGWNGAVFSRLLAFAHGIHLPAQGASAREADHATSPDLLLALLWKATLERALTRSQIPREYRTVAENQRYFRGRLRVADHVRLNLTDQSRVFCQYRRLEMDTTINRAVRYTYALLRQSRFAGVLSGLAEYDAKLAAFGVKDQSVETHQIDKIRYTRLNDAYRPVMELCKAVIGRRRAESLGGGTQGSFSFFVDLAELWENYLAGVLRRYLPGYQIYSPNETGGEHLVSGGRRSIRPDLVIEKDGVAVAVLDAKYKHYTQVGHTAESGNAVSRDDLYQMTTYMYHHAPAGHPFLGLFVSPEAGGAEPDVHTMSRHSRHRIGVLNFDLTRWDGREFVAQEMTDAERNFAESVHKLVRMEGSK